MTLSDEDVVSVTRRERFDYVLMLNVLMLNALHHLLEPVSTLRAACRAARRLLAFVRPRAGDTSA